jgi:hypothetical protein
MTQMLRSIFIGTIVLSLFACNDIEKRIVVDKEIDTTKVNGKIFYTDNCLACHNYKGSVDNDSTTLLKMADLDS